MRVKIVEIHERDAHKDDPEIIGLVGNSDSLEYHVEGTPIINNEDFKELILGGWLHGIFKTNNDEYYYFHAVKVEEIAECE